MHQLACVNLPSLALQILRLEQPRWTAFPMAVVDRDDPNGKIIQVNQMAWRLRVRPGMRYAAGLSLAPELRGAVVPEHVVNDHARRIVERLRTYSPRIERHPTRAGVFWLDARGLDRLFGGADAWAARLDAELRQMGWSGQVIVGFSRFGTYATALGGGPSVLEDPHMERVASGQVALSKLGLPPTLLDALHKLNVRTVGQFLRLPRRGVYERFGEAAEQLFEEAQQGLKVPVQDAGRVEVVGDVIELDYPLADSTRLLFLLKGALPGLLRALRRTDDLVAALRLTLNLDRAPTIQTRIEPAQPTEDESLLVDLLRLRLDALELRAGVVRLELMLEAQPAERTQLRLFAQRPARDLEAARRALAEVRADLGADAVGRLACTDGHLPEARWSWEPGTEIERPSARPVDHPRLIRRIYMTPQPLPARTSFEPDGWLVRGLESGPVIHSNGPYMVSGGWWAREIERDYFYAQTKNGDLLWIFYDRGRRRWFLHGTVE